MNTHLTNPLQQPTTTPDVNEQANKLIAAVNEAITPPTNYRDETPVPAIGAAPPVRQPGRPAMSQRATDASVLMLSAGIASVPMGGMAALVIYALGNADPTALAIGAAAPAAFAVPILALSSLVKRAKTAVPAEQHHHYNGTVIQDHRTTTTHTRGVWARTRNELPR